MSAKIIHLPTPERSYVSLYDIFKREGETKDEFYASFFGNPHLRKAYAKHKAEIIKFPVRKSQ